MRDVAKVPFASPPKPKRLSSNFEASCGLIRESTSKREKYCQSQEQDNHQRLSDENL
jgi:hypothetical protein